MPVLVSLNNYVYVVTTHLQVFSLNRPSSCFLFLFFFKGEAEALSKTEGSIDVQNGWKMAGIKADLEMHIGSDDAHHRSTTTLVKEDVPKNRGDTLVEEEGEKSPCKATQGSKKASSKKTKAQLSKGRDFHSFESIVVVWHIFKRS